MNIINENLSYRLVEEKDAQFILDLRTNPKKKKYLTPTKNDFKLQIEWIEKYKIREKNNLEFYFIFFEKNVPVGTYRMYKINKYSFTVGSWLFTSTFDKTTPIMAEIEICDYGFLKLNKEVLLFETKKANKKVLNYCLLKKPIIYKEDEENLYFLLHRDNWAAAKLKLLNVFGIK